MNISPKDLETWLSENRDVIVVDTRPESQRREAPLINVEAKVMAEADLTPENLGERTTLLICQFGIMTQRWIESHDVENVHNLIGGAQAWNEYQASCRDLSRYSRQMALPEIGKAGQFKLLLSKVAVVGIGGLGCPAGQYLASAGVGLLRLIDGDVVDITNLQRQPLFSSKDIGKAKVHVAARNLGLLNPEIDVQPYNVFLTGDNVRDLLDGMDVIVDATDSLSTRFIIDEFSKQHHVPMVYGGLYRFEGQVSVFNHDGGVAYSDLYPPGSSGGPACSDEGIPGMLPGIIGSIEALETVKVLLGIQPNLSGRLLLYDGITHETELVDLTHE